MPDEKPAKPARLRVPGPKATREDIEEYIAKADRLTVKFFGSPVVEVYTLQDYDGTVFELRKGDVAEMSAGRARLLLRDSDVWAKDPEAPDKPATLHKQFEIVN
jgi:hypothetical protein